LVVEEVRRDARGLRIRFDNRASTRFRTKRTRRPPAISGGWASLS